MHVQGEHQAGGGRIKDGAHPVGLHAYHRSDLRAHRQVRSDGGRHCDRLPAIAVMHHPADRPGVCGRAPITLDVLRLSKLAKSGEIETDGKGQAEVFLMLEDGTAYPHKGSLKFRDVTVDPTTGSVTLRMVFPNPDQILLPGMFVRAVIQEGVAKDAILAPQDGVRRNPKGLPLAYVVNQDNVVEQRLLTLDRTIGDKWLVTSGLHAGDRVVVEGSQKIRPGSNR